MKKIQTNIEIGGILSPSLQAAMNRAVSSLNSMSKQTLDAASAGEQLAHKIRQQETDLQGLVKAYADYQLNGQEGSQEAQELAQQIQSLSGDIDENKAKLEAAYTAVDKLGSGMDKTENATDALEGTIKTQGTTLEQLKAKYIELQLEEGDTTEESQELAQQIEKLSTELQENKVKMAAAKQEADKLDHSLDDADEAARKADEGFSMMKMTLANLAADAIREAWQGVKRLAGNIMQLGTEFSGTMAEVQALSGATGEDFELLEATAREYGATTVFSATESAEALKYMSLAGWDANQSTSALGGVLNLAAASGMELGAASDMVTDYLSAFSMEASESAYFADMLAYAQANSNTSAEQLGGAYKNCAANLNAAGQDVQTVTSMLEAMANQGLKGEKAGTAMSAIMRDLTKNMKEGSIEIGDTSIAVQDAEGNYRDLTDILMDVESAVDGMGSAERATALKSTFTADSTKGLNLLLNEGIGDITGYEEALRGCEGAAEDMAETMNDNLRGDMANLNSAWEEFQLKIYDKAEPALRSITQFVTNDVIPAATWLLNHLPELGIVLSAIAGVVVAAKWGAIVAKISMIQKGVMGLMAVLGGISAPVVAVIAVVAGLALTFMHLWRTNEEFRNNIIAIWNGIKEKFDSFMEGILERVNALGFDFEDVTSMMKAAWDGLCSVLAPVFEIAFTTVANVLSAALDILTGLFDVFSGIFTGDWSLMWQGITEVLNGFLELDTALIRAAFNVFKNIASGAWNAIKNATAKVWASITSTISKKLESAKNAVRNAFNTIKTTIASIGSGVLGRVAGTFSSIYSSIKSKIDAARNAVRNAISGIKSAMRFSWSLPHLKLPHVTIKGKFSLDPPSVPKFGISWYKKGAILNQPTIFGAIGNQLQAGGEAGKEAVLPLAELWKKMKQIMLEVFNAVSTTGGSPETTLVTQASKLVTMDDFSLGSLSGAGGTTIIYDFTGFSWSPTLNINGKGDEDDIMEKLRAHEAEFFDWLDEFIHLREAACYE